MLCEQRGNDDVVMRCVCVVFLLVVLCRYKTAICKSIVPHSQSGVVPMSSLSGVGQLGFWEIGEGGTVG